MRRSVASFSLFLSLLFCLFAVLVAVVHGKVDDTSELVAAADTGYSANTFPRNTKGWPETRQEREGGRAEEKVFEDEDYIYTNSLP